MSDPLYPSSATRVTSSKLPARPCGGKSGIITKKVTKWEGGRDERYPSGETIFSNVKQESPA